MRALPQQLFLNNKNTELKELYISVGIRSFAISLVAIYIPIYLFQIGYSIKDVLYYFFYDYGFSIPLSIMSGFYASKYGPKKTMALSYFFAILSFFMLITLDKYSWDLSFIAFVSALALCLFWGSYNLEFSKAKDKKEDGEEVGVMIALVKFGGLTAPLIGGAIASYYNIYLTFFVASFLLLFAIFPLLKTKEITKRRDIDIKNIKLKKILPDLFSYMAASFESATFFVVWPLLTFLFLKEYVYVGSLTTIASIVTIIFILRLGKIVDEKGKTKFIRRGGILNSLQNIYKIFASSAVHIFTANVLANVANALWQVPWTARYFERADEEPRAEYILVMQLFSDIGRFLFIAILILLIPYFAIKDVLILGLVLTSFASLGIGAMK